MINLRVALRSLWNPPLVTAVAILSMALGIGANGAMFSIFERLILRPLPVVEPGELVNLTSPGLKPGSQSNDMAGGMESIFSYPMMRDLESFADETSGVFRGLAAHRSFGANLAYSGDTVSGEGMMVSGSYFPVLGLAPSLGRLLDREDDRVPGAHPVVVLSHAYWATRFDSSPSVLNEALIVNGQPMTIVGVGPAGFSGTTLGSSPSVFVPISMRQVVQSGWEGFDDRKSYWVYLFARLADGARLEAAAAALNVPYRALLQDVELPLQDGLTDQELDRFAAKEMLLERGDGGQSDLRTNSAVPLALLLAVAGFVLLIACANISNLLLAKASNRAGEIAIRMSIGARRRQVVGQLMAESLLLALFGGALGVFFAHGVLRFIVSLLPPDAAELEMGIGPRALLFLGVLTIFCALVGLFPALHATGDDLVGRLKSQRGQTARSRSAARVRGVMATLQIALSMALLIAAGLFTKSLVNVSRVDLGLETDRLSTFAISPQQNGYSEEECRAILARVERELHSVPGVEMVTSSLVPLIAGSNWGTGVSVQGFEYAPGVDAHTNFNEVGPGYFRTLGIPLLAGREFEISDDLGTPKVAIVNEAFARKFGLDRDAVGTFMAVGVGDVELDIEIVGLVRDAKYSQVKQTVPPVFFTPHRQDESLGFLNFYVRSAGDPTPVIRSLRGVVSRVDPNLPVEKLRTMERQIEETLVLDRVLSILSAAFSVLATLLAGIGLYGVLAYSVVQRRREIGLRMALGADAGRVRRMILGQVGRITLPGAALGLVAALGIGRVASSLLFELEGSDPGVLVIAVILLLGVALVAALIPARRAARIDPMAVLRDE